MRGKREEGGRREGDERGRREEREGRRDGKGEGKEGEEEGRRKGRRGREMSWGRRQERVECQTVSSC